jgi:hypothetical protein
MRRSTQTLVPLFVVLLAAMLAFPSFLGLHRSAVSAYTQDRSRSDVKSLSKPKRTTPAPRIANGAAPANDNCANAITIASCPFSDTKDTTSASDEVGEPQSTCTLQANSVWYTYSSGAKTSSVTVSTCNSDFDTAIMIWQVPTGSPCDFANFAGVACNDDFCGNGLQSTVGFVANANTTYKIQIGGFDGETGSLAVEVACTVFDCDPVVINGTLGSGAPGFTGMQSSGLQTGRLNRNGVASSCAAPKTCQIFDPTGLRAYDAYQLHNDSGQDACVNITLTEAAAGTCNIQSNAYLNTYSPSNICTGYLGDPGLSSGVPPTPTNFSVTVPAGQTLIVVVHTVNPGETGCAYTLNILGDLCAGFDAAVENSRNLSQFILVSTLTGKYEYHDCSKHITFSGTGKVSSAFCKLFIDDSGPIPKRPDRLIHVELNTCSFVGNATLRFPNSTVMLSFSDPDWRNLRTCP